MSAWSWTALGTWLARAGLVGLFAFAFVFGPQIEDRAWDSGIHVTPAQAAMHAALIADGFTHHHHHAPPPVRQLAAAQPQAPVLQSTGAGLSWGTPFTQALQAELPFVPPSRSTATPTGDEAEPASADLSPSDPPPRVW
ncbi:MAG TPA: hypothetical protein VK009_16675 [Chloroflexota bacterium]|nr:hypothetical protein [Chloroflexota bacterium]